MRIDERREFDAKGEADWKRKRVEVNGRARASGGREDVVNRPGLLLVVFIAFGVCENVEREREGAIGWERARMWRFKEREGREEVKRSIRGERMRKKEEMGGKSGNLGEFGEEEEEEEEETENLFKIDKIKLQRDAKPSYKRRKDVAWAVDGFSVKMKRISPF